MFGPQQVDIIDVTNSIIIVRIPIVSYNNTAEVAVSVTITADTFATVSSAPSAWLYLVEGKVTSVTPSQGQAGTFVIINGTNLLAGGRNITSAYLDGISANVVNYTNRSIYLRIGTDVQRRANFVPGEIHLTIDTGAIVTAAAGVRFLYHELGVITGFSPLVGREGTFVTITGINFTAYGNKIVHVTIAGIDMLQNSIQYNNSDPTKLVVRAGPSNTTISGTILLFVDTGTIISSNTTYNFTYTTPGIISTVTPSSGVEGIGVLITGSDLYITGGSFTNVFLAGIRVTKVVVATRTSIAVIAGSPGAAYNLSTEVLITASDGSVARGNAFRYNLPHKLIIIGPKSGQFGTTVTLELPANFTVSSTHPVLVDDIPALVLSIVGTIVNISVPRPKKIGTYPVNIVIQNSNGELARLVNGFTYIQEGEIIKVMPRSGQQGTIVIVTGHGLLGGGSFIENATLATLPATVVNSSDSSVVLHVARNGDNIDNVLGDVILTANSGAIVRQLRGWTAVVPAVILSVQPEEGQFGSYITIIGRNLLQGDLSISSIQLAGVNAYSIVNISSTAIVIRAPSISFSPSKRSAGQRGSIRIVLESGAYIESTILWSYTPQTTISSVFPVIGAVGSTVTIQLAHYYSDSDNITTVLLGNTNCNILAVGLDFVNITVLAGKYSTQPVGMVIETASGVIISKDAVFTVEESGNIQTVTPNVLQQGINVNISGYNFLGRGNATYIMAVWLAGVKANNIISHNNNSVVVEAGYSRRNVSRSIEIILNTAVVLQSNITVSYYNSEILSISPSSGYNATQLNITGINLIQPNSTLSNVMIGTIMATVEDYSHSYIIARAGEPNVSDININMTVRVKSHSGAYIELHNGWRYIAIPNITSVQPNTLLGGEIVTIFGRNLPIIDNASTILIGGISVPQLLYANSTVIQVRAPYGINRTELQNIQIFAADKSVVTSAPLLKYNAVNYSILNVSPHAGESGVEVNITFNLVPPNITSVYLAGVNVTNITHITNTSLAVTAGYGSNTTGDVIVETATGLLLGLQNGWSYLPELNSSLVTPQQGQGGTLVSIHVGVSLLAKYNIGTVSLAGVTANIVNSTVDTVLLKAGTAPATDLSDITLYFKGGIDLLIPQSWTYLPYINITSVSNNATGYFGTVVVVYGTNFLNGQPIKVNVTLAGNIHTDVLSANDTTIICNISQFVDSNYLPIVGPVTVQNTLGFRASTSGRLNFTYLNVDVMNVFPNQGQNGTIVTIQGTGLLAGAASITQVLLNDILVNTVIIATNNAIIIQAAYSNTSTAVGNITYITDTGAKITIPNVWHYVPPAVVSSVTPINGTEGSVVTIRGTGLLAGSNIGPSLVTEVYLDETATSTVLLAFDTLIQVKTNFSSQADTMPGAVSIQLSSGAWIFATQTFHYFQPGVITSVSPLEGQNGTIVNITGDYLYPTGDSLETATLAGVNALIISATTSFIQVVATRPSTLESFSGAIVIQAISGAVLKYEISNFTYLQEGIIYSVSPLKGQTGTTVEIKGYNLFGGGITIQGVWLAGIAAYISPNSSNDYIIVTAGEYVASYNRNITGDVLIVSTSGAHIRRISGWVYVQRGIITNITPSSGQYGTEIAIIGVRMLSGATDVSSVTIGGVPVDVTVSNDSVIRGHIGDPMSSSPFDGTVVITSSDGGVLVSDYTWRYNERGMIDTFTPTTGGNEAIITITGTNLLGSGRQIVQVTIADIYIASTVFQNNTMVIVQVGISAVALNVTGPIVLVADTGAIIQSTDLFTLFVPCDLNQFIVNNSNSIDCVSCSSVCALCSGPTDSDCIECSPDSFLVQAFSNDTQLCTKQCTKFANDDRECVDYCEVDQYQSRNNAENMTFCYDCNELCAQNSSCTGPAPTQCSQCMYFHYRTECVRECPQNTFADETNNCVHCHSLCNQSTSCTGPSSADCGDCAQFTIRGDASNVCTDKCPSNYYIVGSTCLPCDPLCLGRCTGDGPQHCEECRFAGMRLPDGSIECVTNCNGASANIYYLDNNTGLCERCSDLCSPVDGCDGPSASDCHRCHGLNSISTSTSAAFRFNTGCILDCSLMSNDSTQYYNDLVTLTCQLCDTTCDRGCTGPGPLNCITATAVDETELFEAGTGIIIIFFALCVLLVILIVICCIALLIQKKCYRSKDLYQLGHDGGQGTGIENRYVGVAETQFNRPAAATIKGTSEELDANKPHADMSAKENVMKMKTEDVLEVNPAGIELYVDLPDASQPNDNLAKANPITRGEDYEHPVSESATVISNACSEDNDIYEDTTEPSRSADHENDPPVPVPSPGRNKRSSIPIPSNPLQMSVSRMTSQQQVEEGAIYEETQVEDSIYDDIVAITEGVRPRTASKPT